MKEENLKKRFLVVEDDPGIQRLVSRLLNRFDANVDVVGDGEAALQQALEQDYNLIFLDVELPSLNGTDVCRKILEKKPEQPIVMVTSFDDEIDRVLGLELGADDYICKPFKQREFIARVNAVLRRYERTRKFQVPAAGGEDEEVLRRYDLTIDRSRRKVLRGEEEVELTAIEFDLLYFLAKFPGRVWSREQLINNVWEYNSIGYEKVVTSYLSRLRNKLEHDSQNPKYIETVHGVGYRFSESASEE